MTHWCYLDTVDYNGPLKSNGSILSRRGCPYRGTTVCFSCPFAECIPVVCDYGCATCEHRAGCKCGYDQSSTLLTMGVILPVVP